MEVVNNTNDILIQLYDHQLILWLPEKINQYQITELKKLAIQIEQINKNCFKNHHPLVDVYTTFCEGDIAELEDLKSLEKYLFQLEKNNLPKHK